MAHPKLSIHSEQFVSVPVIFRRRPASFAQQSTQKIISGLSRIVDFLCGSHEPQIAVRRDRAGQPFYRVYDPRDRQVHRFDSETEVRVWLESRYYQ